MKRLLASIVLVAAFFLFGARAAHAGTSDNMTGWAWSSTIGWISFNCTNDSTCGTVNYGVNKDGSGNLTGYAWSSSVGWIQFGGLSGFPTGGGTTATNATMSGSSMLGWARALANGGGWDGWISLQGTSPSYGVTLSGTTFSGYAWGGDVVGWVLFDVGTQYPGVCTNCGVSLSGDASLDVTVGGVSIVGQTNVVYGSAATFVWTLTNLPGGTTCAVSKTSSGGTSYSATGITASGASSPTTSLINSAYTFQIACSNGTTKTVSFTVLPQAASFSLGGTETARIQILPAGAADSEQKAVFVLPSGGYSSDVNVSISSFPTPPASTTFTYSFNGGSSFVSNPGTATLHSDYSTGIGFKVRVARAAGAPAFTSLYTITLQGVGSGVPTVYKDIILTPASSTQVYDEH